MHTSPSLFPVQVPNSSILMPDQPSPPIVMHSTQTRSKSGIHKPKLFMDAREPSTVQDALQQPEWKDAMSAEYLSLLHDNIWSLVDLPSNRQAIGCKWVLKVKENPDGSILKYKARLAAKGFHQIAGFDFNETFSPVVKPTTIRVVLSLALSRGWLVKQIDVNNAFLNGDLQEEVYMTQLEGFEDPKAPTLVCKLHNALYGLKQAPRAWFEKLWTALTQFGFSSAKSDQSLFIRFHSQHMTLVLVYVDDILITGSDSTEVVSFIN